jgi:hypothetical protein
MSNTLSYFMGRDGFTWFMGVCEDRDDPKAMGRIRVRCFGYHTDDLQKIPTQDLPWAHVIMPPTAQVGAFHNIRPGDWVFGFFRDPDYLQEPVILGVMVGIPAAAPDPSKGFSDPNSPDAPEPQAEKYKKEPDFGPYPARPGFADTSRLTSGLLEAHPEIEERDTAFTKDVPTANEKMILQNADDTISITSSAPVDTASSWEEKIATNIDPTATTWKEPITTEDSIRGKDATGKNPETQEDRVAPYKRRNTEYPYNHVLETESGHIKEYDDTPYAERIYEKHRSGTFYEIDADGNKITRVVGQNYQIIAGSDFVNVKGDVNLTIDGNAKTYIKGDWNVQVDGNKKEVVKGDVVEEYGSNPITNFHSSTVTGFRTKTILGLENENVIGLVTHAYAAAKIELVTGNVTETFGANQTTKITGNLDVDAARIDLN